MNKEMSKISVIIPTYNEAGNIIRLVKAVEEVILKHNLRAEVIIVDDDSPDGTGMIAKEKFKDNKGIKVYVRKKERGLATAILTGIRKSMGDVVLGMDADFNHNPKDIPRFVEKLAHCDLVVGSRFIGSGGMDDKFRYFLTLVFNLILRTFFKFPTTDNISGYYAIKKEKLLCLPLQFIYQGYGEYHLRLVYLAGKYGLVINEIPVYYHQRYYGQSKSNLALLFFKYLECALNLVSEKDYKDKL